MSNLKIAIDAGHGLMTSGKRCMKRLDNNETREWALNSRIANILQEKLVLYNCEVLRVDDITGAIDISLAKRVKSANDWGADVYISIHHDAGANGGTAGGTTVFYCSSKMERCVQAQNLYNCIIKHTKLVGDRATRIRNHGYYVLKKTKMSAFLVENGFMDSISDISTILSKKHATNTANGIIDFLTSSFSLTKKEASEVVAKPVVAPTGFKVKVIVNFLNIRKGPSSVKYGKVGTINGGGVYTIIKTEGNWGFLKSGAGWINISSKYCQRL